MDINTALNNSIKIIAIIIGILVIIILLMQITGYKLNLKSLTFNKEECIAQMNKTPNDQLGRIGREDKLNDWQIMCGKPSLFIKNNNYIR